MARRGLFSWLGLLFGVMAACAGEDDRPGAAVDEGAHGGVTPNDDESTEGDESPADGDSIEEGEVRGASSTIPGKNVRLCAGEPMQPVCCRPGDLCRVARADGCQAIYRCASVGPGTCDQPSPGAPGFARAFVPLDPPAGATCTNEGALCVFEYRTTAGPLQPTSPLVTACEQGFAKKLSYTPGSCPNPPACSNAGYCTIGFDCCTRYSACVNGVLNETTVCNPGQGSGGACGG
jgi:hypothetical protein